jgi:MGT family glycosyltransferase
VGRSVDPAAFAPLPKNVRVEHYIPNSQLLPRVDAVLCHGGFNTVMGALSFGKPLVLAPITADQPIHAQRCAALGVGRVIDPRPLDPTEIQTATRAVLDNSSYRDAARHLQHEIAALPDLAATAAIIEKAAYTR